MRKYLLNGSIISAVFGAISTIRTTKNNPKDWRTVVVWVSWGCSLALAVGSVIRESDDARMKELAGEGDTKGRGSRKRS